MNKKQNNNIHRSPTRDNFFESMYSKIAWTFTPSLMIFTPNQITLVSGILGLLGCFFLFFNNSYFYLLTGAILIQLYALLDLVDGNIARQKKMQSNCGMWLDVFFDKLIDFMLILIVSLGVYFHTQEYYVLISGIILMGLNFFIQQIMLMNNTYFKLVRNSNLKSFINPQREVDLNSPIFIPIIFYRKHLSLQHNTFLFLISFFAIINKLEFGIYFLTFHAFISIILLILANFIRIR